MNKKFFFLGTVTGIPLIHTRKGLTLEKNINTNNINMKKLLYLLPVLAVLLASCDKDEKISMPGVTTLAATDVDMFTATLNGIVSLPEQIAIDFEIGFEVSEDQSFPEASTTRYKVKNYKPDKTFTYSLNNLNLNTTYYFRTYMVNLMCLYTGDMVSVSTTNVKVSTGDIDLEKYSVTSSSNVRKLICYYNQCGVCYGTYEYPNVHNSVTVSADTIDESGNFTVTLKNIPYTTVYYCSYVRIGYEYYYGEVKSFYRNYNVAVGEAVDLGLSVKWANFNVGATKPEEYGDYFAWGETVPKIDYYRSNYKFSSKSDSTMTKYIIDSTYIKDSTYINNNMYWKTVLDLEDDAAHVNWGGSWRMPTKAEQDELLNNCTWTWTTLNRVNGYKVQSNKFGYTDRWIFLPAAGYTYGSYISGGGDNGYYWSSSLYTYDPNDAYRLNFYSYYVDRYYYYCSVRYSGLSVRPVCP